jgi:hypothetical protein
MDVAIHPKLVFDWYRPLVIGFILFVLIATDYKIFNSIFKKLFKLSFS